VLAQLTHLASASRYAGCNVYGLAAGLAASWAVLAASSADALQKRVAYSFLVGCAPLLQQASPLACPPAAGCSAPGFYKKPRLRAPQVVELWCVWNESAAWGEDATPRVAILTQYHSSMAAVLVWLTSAADSLPPIVLSLESGVVQDGDQEHTLHAAARVRAPRVSLPAVVALSVWRIASWPGAAPALCGDAVR
jgi:hypothetical protein